MYNMEEVKMALIKRGWTDVWIAACSDTLLIWAYKEGEEEE